MATANINIPMLEAGKKYRLLLNPSQDSTYSFNVPSIDFTVPPSVRLISSYTPTTSTATSGANITTSVTTYTTYSGNISDWSRSAGYYTYYFKVGSIANSLSTSDHIKVKDISSGDHRYYDNLKYRVKARNVGPGGTAQTGWIQCIASYDTNFAKFCHPSSTNSHPHNDYNYWNPLGSYWKYLDGRALSSGTNANSATFKWTRATGVVTTVAYYNDIIYIPADFSLSNLIQTTNIRDIIIYFYKKDNDYYYVNYGYVQDSSVSPPTPYTPVLVDPGSPVSMEDLTGKDPGDPLPFSMYDYLANNRFVSASNYNPDKYTSGASPITYYFTVARYIKNDSGTWEGKWLQVDNSWYENPSMDKIIFSQKAEVV